MKTMILFCMLHLAACISETAVVNKVMGESEVQAEEKASHWEGVFTNGMKETTLSFDLSANGKQLSELTFNGYWRCGGRLTKDILGPEKTFAVTNGAIDGVYVDSTAYIRYEIKGKITGNKAAGTFRMSINGLGCDTYVLNWTAAPKK